MKEAAAAGGYAKEMSARTSRGSRRRSSPTRQEAGHRHHHRADPGKARAALITEDMVKSMRPGSVLVDLAAEAGGNCALTETRQGRREARRQDRRPSQRAGRLPKDATALYARNVFNFLAPHVDKQSEGAELQVGRRDGAGTLVTRDGKVVNPMLAGEAQVAMDQSTIVDQAVKLANEAARLAEQAGQLAASATQMAAPEAVAGGGHFLSCSPSSSSRASSAFTSSGASRRPCTRR